MMLLVYVQDLKDPIPQNIFPCTCGFRTIQDTNSLERRLQMLIDHDPEKKKKKKDELQKPKKPQNENFYPLASVGRQPRYPGLGRPHPLDSDLDLSHYFLEQLVHLRWVSQDRDDGPGLVFVIQDEISFPTPVLHRLPLERDFGDDLGRHRGLVDGTLGEYSQEGAESGSGLVGHANRQRSGGREMALSGQVAGVEGKDVERNAAGLMKSKRLAGDAPGDTLGPQGRTKQR